MRSAKSIAFSDAARAPAASTSRATELSPGLSFPSATHSPTKAGGYFAARDTTSGEKAAQTAAAASRHPVVRVHPETGRKSIFVNPLFTDKIDGLRRRESDALLSLIQDVAVQPERMLRWRWQTGDLAFWDNRCTMHYALRDFGDAPRRMIRVALEGDRPNGIAGDHAGHP